MSNPITVSLRGRSARALDAQYDSTQPEIALREVCRKLIAAGMKDDLPVAKGWTVATLPSLRVAADPATYTKSFKRQLTPRRELATNDC